MIGLPYNIIVPTVIQLVTALNDIHPALAFLGYIGILILVFFLIRLLCKMGD